MTIQERLAAVRRELDAIESQLALLAPNEFPSWPPASNPAAALLALLNDGQGHERGDVLRTLGLTPQSIQAALSTLQAQGHTVKTRRVRAAETLYPTLEYFLAPGGSTIQPT